LRRVLSVPSVTKLLEPLFLDPKLAGQGETVLWYATWIFLTQDSLVGRIGAVIDDGDLIRLMATDKVSRLQSQHQRVNPFLRKLIVKWQLCQT
jgi:hypothetical protein